MSMYRAVGLVLIAGVGVAIVLVLHPWLSQAPTAQPLHAQPGTIPTERSLPPPAEPLPVYTHADRPLGTRPWTGPAGAGPAPLGASDAVQPEPPRAIRDSLGALLRRLQEMRLADWQLLVREEIAGSLVRWELRVVAVHERSDAAGQPLFQVILEDPGYRKAHSVWCEVGPDAADQVRGMAEGSRVTVTGSILDMTPRSLVIKDCRLNEDAEPKG